jgi:very-short-patch-repair endonuclease
MGAYPVAMTADAPQSSGGPAPSSGASRHLFPDGEKNGASGTATRRARQLRKQGTDAENRLWYVLRNRTLDGLKFVRQMPVGPYFADFACREVALIVELDGGQHAESDRDIRRTSFLLSQGYSVLRFWNNDVMCNRDGVLETIRAVIAGNPSPDLRYAQATLSPTGRGIRGVRAASAALTARLSNEAPPVPLPVGERVDRPQAETGEGSLSNTGKQP